MIHPKTELRFINDIVGYGVVATEFIPKGTITWVFDKLDREFTFAEFQSLNEVYKEILLNYTFRNNRGNFVLCWDHGRYVNHSFKSNCLSTAYDFEIAIKDIHPGEQLTDDYGYLNIIEPFRAIDEGAKRKIVYPNDLQKYSKVWDTKISRVFGKIHKIQQPLKPMFSESNWENIIAVCEGKKELDSIFNNYYDDKENPHQFLFS